MAWAYSKAESVSKSVDNSGSFVLGTAVTGSISVAGASTDGESLFAGDILCFPKKTKRKKAKARARLLHGRHVTLDTTTLKIVTWYHYEDRYHSI